MKSFPFDPKISFVPFDSKIPLFLLIRRSLCSFNIDPHIYFGLAQGRKMHPFQKARRPKGINLTLLTHHQSLYLSRGLVR